MNTKDSLIPAARFLELLAAKRSEFSCLNVSSTTVTGDVCINGKEINLASEPNQQPSIHLENFNFLGYVMIENFEDLSFSAQNTNFLKYLDFRACSGKWLSIHGCRMERLDGFRNKFKALSLKDVQGSPAANPEYQKHPVIQIAGFELSEKLLMQNVKAEELQLTCHTGTFFKAPAATVDDPLWAMQLRLAGVNVYVSSQVAAKMLASGSYAERMPSVA